LKIEVLTAAERSMLILWVVMPCVLVGRTDVSEEHTASIFRILLTLPHGFRSEVTNIDVFIGLGPFMSVSRKLLQSVLALRNFVHKKFYNEGYNLCLARYMPGNSFIRNIPNEDFPSHPIKCTSTHFSALEYDKRKEDKGKRNVDFLIVVQ
jgi:hypothetical protein